MSAAPGAAAQTDPVSIEVFVADAVVPEGGTGFASFFVQPSRAVTLTEIRLTFDLAGIAGIATIDPDSISYPCTTSGTQLVCESDFDEEFDELGINLFDIALVADPAGSVGAAGELTVTLEAAGVTPATDQSTVTLGAPVDLAAGGPAQATSAPGETLSLPWTVQNGGPEPAHGVALRAFKDFVVRPQTRHSNCVYFDDDESGRNGPLCMFDVVLEPGTTYRFATPFELAVGEDARAPGGAFIEGVWITRAEAAASLEEAGGTPGTGSELSLVEVGGGAPDPLPADPVPAADPDQENNWITTDVTVEGDNQPDFAAVGAELSGEAGDTVAVELGVENAGTATADASRSGESVNLVLVTMPDGVTAVAVSDDCGPIRGDQFDFGSAGEPGHAAYMCDADLILPAGESVLFEFTLRIDEVIADATGTVRVNQAPVLGEAPAEDINPGNDTAEIIVNASGGGGGGGLPVTGAAPGVVALAGLLLIGLGGAGVLLVRHRRTRFVA